MTLLPPDSHDPSEEITNKSFTGYLLELSRLGGPPFVLMGLAIGNLTISNSPGYAATEQLIGSSFLFVAGTFAWLMGMVLEYKRWKISTEINAQREAKTIEAIYRLVEVRDPKSARELIDILSDAARSFQTKPTGTESIVSEPKALVSPEKE